MICISIIQAKFKEDWKLYKLSLLSDQLLLLCDKFIVLFSQTLVIMSERLAKTNKLFRISGTISHLGDHFTC